MSEFEITNPKRFQPDESESADIVQSTIMTTSITGSKNLTGKIVRMRASGGRSGSRERSGGRNSLHRYDFSEENVNPA